MIALNTVSGRNMVKKWNKEGEEEEGEEEGERE